MMNIKALTAAITSGLLIMGSSVLYADGILETETNTAPAVTEVTESIPTADQDQLQDQIQDQLQVDQETSEDGDKRRDQTRDQRLKEDQDRTRDQLHKGDDDNDGEKSQQQNHYQKEIKNQWQKSERPETAPHAERKSVERPDIPARDMRGDNQ